jgi:exocyst complex component 2
MDNKSLRLITDASVSSPVSREKSQGLDPNLRDKVVYSSPNFDPKVFLSWVHKDTSAADLESGALTLKTDLKGRTQQKKQLVKENFDCFVSCKTTIDDIESKLRQIEEDPEGAGTSHLHSVTQKISGVANRAFEPLFERHKLRRSDLSRECFKDSEHYLTYQVQSVGTLEKENMILLSESTKKQSQLFFLPMWGY